MIFQTDEDGESAWGGALSPKLESVAGELLGCFLWYVCIPGSWPMGMMEISPEPTGK